MAKQSPDRAYLIRCWQEGDAVHRPRRWRFSAEEVLHERKGRGFADLDSLLDYLRAELGKEQADNRTIRVQTKVV
jgi:hypothetical protein